MSYKIRARRRKGRDTHENVGRGGVRARVSTGSQWEGGRGVIQEYDTTLSMHAYEMHQTFQQEKGPRPTPHQRKLSMIRTEARSQDRSHGMRLPSSFLWPRSNSLTPHRRTTLLSTIICGRSFWYACHKATAKLLPARMNDSYDSSA